MNQSKAPEMSVVIVTPNDYAVIRRTIRFLRAQTVKDRLEVVIGAPSRAQLGLIESDLAGFHSHKVVEVGEIRILTEAKVATVAESSAPIVAFAEDHCYPEPGWAEALIAAHRKEHAAVGPLMRNANPATALSWTGLFLHYGCCIQPVLSGPCTNLPWHNTSYKRRLLLDYGSELASMLMVEGILFDDLRAKGHTLQLEPAAQTNHVNISIFSSWILHAFWGGRLFGAMRARKKKWPVWKRLICIAGSPLIPVMRIYKTAQRLREVGKGALLPRMIPALLAGLLPHVVGQVTGYAVGLGHAEERYSFFEMNRFLHVTSNERQIMFE